PRLQLVNLACSGETTQTMMAHSLCAPGGSQLRNAVSFLRTHRGATALVTIDIGGNDVVNCVSAANSTTCFTKNLAVMKGQLTYILDALRQAAGPSVPIVTGSVPGRRARKPAPGCRPSACWTQR
ncbi:MAG TPA: SGNH/GDSL hydrolase family protein, partial [Acidimicrobiales bacterium]|nr:SGNH/GDSL hydrolase family protein [Acidimicrobiales bacterium]